MALLRCDEFDTTVTMLLVVPFDKFPHPITCIFQSFEALAWITWSIFQSTEEGLSVSVIVRYARPISQDRRLVVNHGVICQTDQVGANWIVVDKW